jgi:hypothetical protein
VGSGAHSEEVAPLNRRIEKGTVSPLDFEWYWSIRALRPYAVNHFTLPALVVRNAPYLHSLRAAMCTYMTSAYDKRLELESVGAGVMTAILGGAEQFAPASIGTGGAAAHSALFSPRFQRLGNIGCNERVWEAARGREWQTHENIDVASTSS